MGSNPALSNVKMKNKPGRKRTVLAAFVRSSYSLPYGIFEVPLANLNSTV